MSFHRPSRVLLPAVLLAASAGAALAESPEACRDRAAGPEAQVAACAEAIAAATDPHERAELLSERGRAHRLMGEFDLADADISEAERLAPEDADPLVDRGYLLLDEGDADGAVAAPARAVELEPDYFRSVLAYMDVLADAGQPQKCLEVAPHAIEIVPERPETWAFRGRCLADLGRNEEAVADYRKAIGIGLEESYLYENLANALDSLGRPEEAVEPARRAVELDPTRESARIWLTIALVDAGKADEAVEAYHDAQADGVEDTMGQANGLAWNLYLAGHSDKALPVMEDWLAAHPELGPDNVYELDTTGHILAALGQTDKAVAMFLRATEVGGPDHRAYYEGRLKELGHDPKDGFEAALSACVAEGTKCLLTP